MQQHILIVEVVLVVLLYQRLKFDEEQVAKLHFCSLKLFFDFILSS